MNDPDLFLLVAFSACSLSLFIHPQRTGVCAASQLAFRQLIEDFISLLDRCETALGNYACRAVVSCHLFNKALPLLADVTTTDSTFNLDAELFQEHNVSATSGNTLRD